MHNVVPFPKAHAQALGQSSRAAKAMSLSEVKPEDSAVSVDKIAAHLSDGMLSRCHHLLTAERPALMSAASASFDGQSRITSLKDFSSVMKRRLGQMVLKRKDKLALDEKKFLGHNVRMTESDAEKQFKQQFIERVATARVATGKKQWQVAELLNVPQDHYKHWEKGRLMPHHLIGRFCLVTNVDPVWLMTGKGQKPLKPPQLVEDDEPRSTPKPKRMKRSNAA